MGNKYSKINSEKLSWLDHDLRFDETVRQANLRFIESCFPIKSSIHLAYCDSNFGGLNYQHWFITDNGQHFLELWSPSGLYEARVQINTNPHPDYIIEKVPNTVVVTKAIRERMKQLLGMSNYSLCLRNCEHVANYIFRGRWVSFQMEGRGALISYFRSLLMENVEKKVNTFPSTIKPVTVNIEDGGRKKLYSFIENSFTPREYHYFLDTNEGTYNILVVGPTGAGKSRLINLFFNSDICPSNVSHRSVTKELRFIKGTGIMINLQTNRREHKKIAVADTIGLCDTDWDDSKILELVKGRVSCNLKAIDAVFVVFRADRLLKEHISNIKHIMDWLHYKDKNNHLNFLFVGTFSENLTDDDKEQLKTEAKEILELRETTREGDDGESHDSLIYVGFPPEDKLNDEGKKQIKDSWDLLQPLLRLEDGKALTNYNKIVGETKSWGSRLYVGFRYIRDLCNIL